MLCDAVRLCQFIAVGPQVRESNSNVTLKFHLHEAGLKRIPKTDAQKARGLYCDRQAQIKRWPA
jgi:hypothetical protein